MTPTLEILFVMVIFLGLLAAGIFGDRAPRLTLNVMHAGLAVAIVLTALFATQRYGTAKVGRVFGPITMRLYNRKS